MISPTKSAKKQPDSERLGKGAAAEVELREAEIWAAVAEELRVVEIRLTGM